MITLSQLSIGQVSAHVLHIMFWAPSLPSLHTAVPVQRGLSLGRQRSDNQGERPYSGLEGNSKGDSSRDSVNTVGNLGNLYSHCKSEGLVP